MRDRESKKINDKTKNKRIRIKENEIIQEEVVDNLKEKQTSSKKKKSGLHSEIKSRKEKKKWDKKKKIKLVLGIFLSIILIIGIVFGTYIYKSDGNIADAALSMAADVLGDEDPIFVLVLGISEDITSKLTDTIILAGYNPDSQKAFMLSIPRDTFVGKSEATAGGYDKINALYQSGPEKTVAAVEKLTGIKIDNYVIVRNTVLPAIVDAIGEVEFNVPIDMDYDDPTQNLHIQFEAGVQMINGEEAEELLRFRHNNDGTSYPVEYGDNDYGRMRTQREFIMAVAKKLISLENVSKLKEIATAVFNNLETDMSIAKMLGYLPHAAKFDMSNARTEQLPGASAKINELWFYRNDSYETYDLIHELLAELELTEKEIDKYYTPTKRVKNPVTTTQNKTEDNSAEHTHNYTEIVTRVPSCTREGQKRLTCSCGDTYTESIEKTSHTFDKAIENITGNKKTITKKCIECGYTDTKTETLNTNTTNTNSTNTSNTNTTVNNTTNTNTSTGGNTTTSEHAHSYTETITTPATCTTNGTKTYKCSCGHSYTEKITATGHSMVNGTCSVCGHTEQHTHSYTETITTPATCTTNGTKTFTCSCGHSYTENITASHNMVSGTCSVCGHTEAAVNTTSET